MGSEVSDRTVLQDEHLLRAAERNHSMCDRIGTQHVLHDQSLHLRGELRRVQASYPPGTSP